MFYANSASIWAIGGEGDILYEKQYLQISMGCEFALLALFCMFVNVIKTPSIQVESNRPKYHYFFYFTNFSFCQS